MKNSMTEKESAPKILLVDDEEDILEFVSYNLEREGFKVYTGRNGREVSYFQLVFFIICLYQML